MNNEILPFILMMPLVWAVISYLILRFIGIDAFSSVLGGLFVILFLIGLGMVLV